tara:strand:+ start:1397 stop:1579 length:183 start_codon:yes stop_codon:yes gene_type:complete
VLPELVIIIGFRVNGVLEDSKIVGVRLFSGILVGGVDPIAPRSIVGLITPIIVSGLGVGI